MADAYPRWGYPPDGGPGKVIDSPDDWPKGWSQTPVVPQSAGGERIIGQPIEHFPPPPDPDPTHVVSEVVKTKPKK